MEDAEVAKQSTDFFDGNTIRNIRSRLDQNGPAANCCTCCGAEIPKARRIAIPGCQLCVVCKTNIEKGGRP